MSDDRDEFTPDERAELRRRYSASQGETLKWADLVKLHNFTVAPANDSGEATPEKAASRTGETP